MPPADQSPSAAPERSRFSRIQVFEATAASCLAAAILCTSAGMGWLVLSLPNRLQQLETQITLILKNQDIYREDFKQLKQQVDGIDRRVIRLEVEQ